MMICWTFYFWSNQWQHWWRWGCNVVRVSSWMLVVSAPELSYRKAKQNFDSYMLAMYIDLSDGKSYQKWITKQQSEKKVAQSYDSWCWISRATLWEKHCLRIGPSCIYLCKLHCNAKSISEQRFLFCRDVIMACNSSYHVCTAANSGHGKMCSLSSFSSLHCLHWRVSAHCCRCKEELFGDHQCIGFTIVARLCAGILQRYVRKCL